MYWCGCYYFWLWLLFLVLFSPLHFTYFLSIRKRPIRVFRASQQHMTQRHSYAYIYKCIRQAKSGYVHHHQQHPSPISRTHMLELSEQSVRMERSDFVVTVYAHPCHSLHIHFKLIVDCKALCFSLIGQEFQQYQKKY